MQPGRVHDPSLRHWWVFGHNDVIWSSLIFWHLHTSQDDSSPCYGISFLCWRVPQHHLQIRNQKCLVLSLQTHRICVEFEFMSLYQFSCIHVFMQFVYMYALHSITTFPDTWLGSNTCCHASRPGKAPAPSRISCISLKANSFGFWSWLKTATKVHHRQVIHFCLHLTGTPQNEMTAAHGVLVSNIQVEVPLEGRISSKT